MSRMAPSVLHLLTVQPPAILLPTSRLTLPVASDVGDALVDLVGSSDTLPVVAVVPLSPPLDNAAPALAEWGTAARVLRIAKPPTRSSNQPYIISLHGLARIKPLHPHPHNPPLSDFLPSFQVQYLPADKVPNRETIARFKQASLRLLDRLARDALQPARKESYIKIATMLEDIADARTPWMADVLVGSIDTDYNDKLAVLNTPDVNARLSLAADIFLKEASISEVSKKIASAVDESLSKQQKEFFLRQQLAAIQRELSALQRGVSTPTTSSSANNGATSELDDDDQHEVDDLADLKKQIEAMQSGTEERKMGIREWRRLKRIPQGSVENGVIRSYLEWLTSIPWPNSSTSSFSIPSSVIRDKTFLTKARTQLDADHFGLDKIKKRLIEYLAVVRLKELNADKEAREAAAEEPAKQAETVAPIEAGKPAPQAPPPSDVPVPLTNPSPPTPLSKPRSPSTKGPILLFVGPPGTGKTSLGQSIARALGRPFQRISLGGVRDEAEIRGHRRTYVASGPGLIVQALRKASCVDPVILLDEVDKIGQSNFHGDPSAALLEVLDPEQNWSFNDHYINVPIDLSQVLFICTANSLDTISSPLLDRCEIVHLAGYTFDEKVAIANRFLVPKQVGMNGLKNQYVEISDETLREIVTGWTREAGVRSLERAIAGVVRFKAVQWAEWVEKCESDGKVGYVPSSEELESLSASSTTVLYNPTVCPSDLETILGLPRFSSDTSDSFTSSDRDSDKRPGIVYGLVVMGQGEGGILPVETILLPGGNGRLKLTGSLGEVIKESGELALSWVKRHAWELGLVEKRMGDPLRVFVNGGRTSGEGKKKDNHGIESDLDTNGGQGLDVHLHLPAGAQKKDGPSAGIAMVCALVSLLTGSCVPTNIAMTGEITLRGKVTPVGGIKEKILGAHRAGITKVLLPYSNRKDVEHDVPKEIKNEIKFAFVRNVGEALEEAFGKEVVEGWKKMSGRKRGPSRRGRGGDDVNGDDDEWDGSESGNDQDVFERRGVVWVESRL